LASADDTRDTLRVVVAQRRARVRDHSCRPRKIGRHGAARFCLRPPSVQADLMDPATMITSEIQEQSDRLEGLRVLDPRLNAAEVRARTSQLQDRQVLD